MTLSPADGNLILSVRHQDWVIKIDYRNGAGRRPRRLAAGAGRRLHRQLHGPEPVVLPPAQRPLHRRPHADPLRQRQHAAGERSQRPQPRTGVDARRDEHDGDPGGQRRPGQLLVPARGRPAALERELFLHVREPGPEPPNDVRPNDRGPAGRDHESTSSGSPRRSTAPTGCGPCTRGSTTRWRGHPRRSRASSSTTAPPSGPWSTASPSPSAGPRSSTPGRSSCAGRTAAWWTASVSISLVGGKTVAVLTFAGSEFVGGSLADGNYTLTVRADRVHDRWGRELDGDGDGSAGGDRVDGFFRLFGDSDGDGDVDAARPAPLPGSFGSQDRPGRLPVVLRLRRQRQRGRCGPTPVRSADSLTRKVSARPDRLKVAGSFRWGSKRPRPHR